MPWIRMNRDGTPEMNAGAPRVIEDPDRAEVEPPEDTRILTTLRPDELVSARWFEFFDNPVLEDVYEPGEPVYTTTGGRVSRTFPDAAYLDIERLRSYMRGNAMREYRRHRSNLTFGGQVYRCDADRAGVVALQLLTTRTAGYRVETLDGTFIPMTDTGFRDFAVAMADHMEAAEQWWFGLRDHIDGEIDSDRVLAIDVIVGW